FTCTNSPTVVVDPAAKYFTRHFYRVAQGTLPVEGPADFILTTNNGTITIAGYTGAGGILTIPNAVNGLAVTSIENYAFYGLASLTSVIIPGNVTSIG